MDFSKSHRRFLEGSSVLPSDFLSQKLQNALYEQFRFIPTNVYVANAAGDYVFVSVVVDKQVFTMTDCYSLGDEIKDKE